VHGGLIVDGHDDVAVIGSSHATEVSSLVEELFEGPMTKFTKRNIATDHISVLVWNIAILSDSEDRVASVATYA
jgi:hypothetical protein